MNPSNRAPGASAISVYMKMMPFGTKEAHVAAAMSKFGSIKNLKVINDKEADGMNPCAIVYYFAPEAVDAAMAAARVEINGGMVNVGPHMKKSDIQRSM